VVAAAAAAAEDHDVDAGGALQQRECRGDAIWSVRPLNEDAEHPDFGGGPAHAEDFQQVANGGAGGTGDDGDAARKARHGPFALAGEVAEPRQPLFEAAEGQVLSADALGMDFVDHELIVAARQIDTELAADYDLGAFLWHCWQSFDAG